MAKLTISTRKIKKTIEIDEPVISLELSKEEAIVLSILTGQVGGSGKIRKITNELYETLSKFYPEKYSKMFEGNCYIKENAENCLE